MVIIEICLTFGDKAAIFVSFFTHYLMSQQNYSSE